MDWMPVLPLICWTKLNIIYNEELLMPTLQENILSKYVK